MVGTARAVTAPGTGRSLPEPPCRCYMIKVKEIAAGHRLGMQARRCYGVLPSPFPYKDHTLLKQVAKKEDGSRCFLRAHV